MTNPAKRQGGDGEGKRRRKASLEYNLEKDPLESGRVEPRVGLRERATMGTNSFTRTAGWLVVVILVVLVVVGLIAAIKLSGMDDIFWRGE